MSAGFKDHFSGHAARYAQARPGYPDALFAWLAIQAPGHELAWDVATGNGQAAVGLALHFKSVFASDASADQIANAKAPENVRFAVEPAEACSLADAGADLVCVAQALHWFDHGRFYPEVRRVLRSGGLFAAWTYRLNSVTPQIDTVLLELYDGLVGPYWPPERRHIDQGYADLPFPFREIPAPVIPMETRATLQQYLAYLRSWSAVRRYLAAQGQDPVTMLEADFSRAWGDGDLERTVHWPLVLRAGVSGES